MESGQPRVASSAGLIELSLFASRIAAICEEMGAMLGRVAFSPNIRDRLDYSCALFDPRGELLGQATHIPVHLGSMAYAMGGLVGSFQWQAGDMVVFNDPYQGGTHLPDITFVSPVFSGPRLVGFCANRAHHADIGSDAPGSMPLSSRLEQEGIVISPVRIIHAGRLDQAWMENMLAQLHDRAAAQGDFNAQVAANRLGEKRLAALAAVMGDDRLLESGRALQDYAERLARASLAEIPQGTYSFTDFLDDDGFGAGQIPVSLQLHISAGRVIADFAGTAKQVEGNLNCPLSVTAAAVFYVFRCLMPPQVPACAGAMRAVEIRAPLGSLLNAQAPAAVAAGNVETSMRIVDVVCGALAAACPGRIPAASQGSMNNLAMGSRAKPAWDYYETLAGGMGAGPDCHGASARHSHMTNTLNTPVEVLERHYPLRILRYQQNRGSGGDGLFRGGNGVLREYLFLDDAELSILSERRKNPPWGLAGGQPGQAGRNSLDKRDLGGKVQLKVKKGQVLNIQTPGGGGYGSPAG